MVFTSGCRRTEVQNCVGADNLIVGDQFCDDADQQRKNNPNAHYPYRWLFGGSSGGHIGDTVLGGSADPSPGVSAVRGSSVKTGGFGSFFGGIGRASGAAGHASGAGE